MRPRVVVTHLGTQRWVGDKSAWCYRRSTTVDALNAHPHERTEPEPHPPADAQHGDMSSFDDLIHTRRGYFTRAEFLDSGYTDRDLRNAVRAGLLKRLRHGVYVYRAEHEKLSPEQQHVVLVRSVADKLGTTVAVSHQSACATHGLAMYGHPLDKVHVTRLDGSAGRTEHGIVHHVGQVVTDDDIEEIDGMLVTRPARAVFEASTVGTVEAAIVVMDSGLHHEVVTEQELIDLTGRLWNWQGARGAQYALSLADSRSASPGESRSRYLFRRAGLPIPQLQVPIYDADGLLIGYSDFGWLEYHHLGEFDGRIKYGGIPGDRRSPQQIVFDEKRREDAMRSQLLGMSRWTWADIDPEREHRTAQRVAAEIEQSYRLYARGRIVIPLS